MKTTYQSLTVHDPTHADALKTLWPRALLRAPAMCPTRPVIFIAETPKLKSICVAHQAYNDSKIKTEDFIIEEAKVWKPDHDGVYKALTCFMERMERWHHDLRVSADRNHSAGFNDELYGLVIDPELLKRADEWLVENAPNAVAWDHTK